VHQVQNPASYRFQSSELSASAPSAARAPDPTSEPAKARETASNSTDSLIRGRGTSGDKLRSPVYRRAARLRGVVITSISREKTRETPETPGESIVR
jgi:hypothetical protein